MYQIFLLPSTLFCEQSVYARDNIFRLYALYHSQATNSAQTSHSPVMENCCSAFLSVPIFVYSMSLFIISPYFLLVRHSTKEI